MSDLSGVTPQSLRTAAYELTIPDGVDTTLNRLIDKAERTVVDQVPTVPLRLEAGTLRRQSLADVIEDMVLRILRNPDGKRSESSDDYSYTLDQAVASGALYLSDRERSRLTPVTARARIGTIRLGAPSWRFGR